ncbi:MAG TPA: methyltransferase domain-containing protein [Acidimicrobiales bacterium]|nr:methyltransferase domain-containing protein [Acidimicrobiales bacterium]
MWDAQQYERFQDNRSRPFFDLVGRIGDDNPRVVVDLGCGTGKLTATLCDRFPAARVIGIDNSQEMLEGAPAGRDRLSFELGDAASYRPSPEVDVVVSNAMIQWLPDSTGFLARLGADLAATHRPDRAAWIAVQAPAQTGTSQSRLLLDSLRSSPRYADVIGDLGHVESRPVLDPPAYVDLLSPLGWRVDAWETTYAQVLPGEDAVLEWMKGTTLRPLLGRLGEKAPEFLAEYGALLREAFPAAPYGTIFPFRRVFVVAQYR